MTKPLLLDLFCGAGGASMGYYQAGFDVIGVDIEPQPHYPFKFRCGDALAALPRLVRARSIAAVHASPPCQAYSVAAQEQRNLGKAYPQLIYKTRVALQGLGIPFIIENVPTAPVRPDYILCGCNFGLKLRRKRWFEISWATRQIKFGCRHDGPVPSVVGHGTPAWVREQLGYNPTIADYRASMGIHWMNRDELSQAIPPAYTKFIGTHLISRL